MLGPAAGGGAPRTVTIATAVTRTVRWVLHAAPVAVALAAMTVVLLAAGELTRTAPAGIPDAGAAVTWSVAAGRLLMQVCAVLTVGCLLVPVLLDRDGHPDRGSRAPRTAAAWALAWAVCSACLAVLTLWQVTTVPPGRLPSGTLPTAVWALLPARALLLVSLLTAGAALLALAPSRAPRERWDRAALGVAVVALAPPLYTGHAGGAAAHELATGGLLVHVVAATLWVGGLAALALWVRPASLPAAASRFSALALGCYAALVVSGLTTAAAHLGTAPSAWWSGYGAVVATKTLAVVALGLLGHRHRVRTLPELAAGRPRPLLRLATVELLVMGGAVGMATALSRMPGGRRPAEVAAHGGEAADASVAGLTALQGWQPEPVLTTVVLVGLGVLARRTGLLRPGRGRLLLMTGAGLAVLALGLPDDAAGTPLLGLAVARHLVLALALPALVVAALRHGKPSPPSATRPGFWVTPTTAFTALVASTVLVLRLPATWSTGPAPGHLVLPVASLLCAVAVVGAASRTGARSTAEDDAAALTSTSPPRGVLVASALFLGSVAALVLAGGPALVPTGPMDARLAGGLLAGAAVGLLLLAAAYSRGPRDGGPVEHEYDASAAALVINSNAATPSRVTLTGTGR